MAHSLLDALSNAGDQTVLAVQNLLDSQTFQEAMPEDEDIFQCGRCKQEFTSLSTFLNHKQAQCLGISREPGNKDSAVSSCSGDQTVNTSTCGGGQSFIYATPFAQGSSSTHKQFGARLVPVHDYVQNVVLSDELLSFQPVERNLQKQSNMQFILPKSESGSFQQSQVSSSIHGGDRNFVTLSAQSSLSTNCTFLSPALSYTVDENGCLVSSNGLSHAIGGYQIGAGPVAATAQQVIMMQPQFATAQAQRSVSNAFINAGTINKNVGLPATSVVSTNDSATAARRRKIGSWANSASVGQIASGAILKCKYCDKTFTKNFDMQQHIRSHTGEKPFQCIVCGRGFAQKSNVKKHLQTHKVWPQGLTKTLSDKVTLVEDVTMDEKQDLILTSKSENVVTTTIDRIADVIGNPTVSLNSSEVEGDNIDNGFHIIVESPNKHPMRAMIYMQNESGDSELPSTIRDQGSSATEARQLKLIIDNSYSCQYCGSKFTTYYQYKSHMVIHKDEQVYKCVMKSCSESFRELNAFLDHIKQHRNELSYRCHLCNKQLPSLEELSNHQYTHALFPKQGLKPGPKYFRCVKCNSKYATPEALQHHLSTVSHDYHCLQPSCPKVFTCERYLRRHLATHGAFDEFLCAVCNKPFKTEQYLKMHMLIHSNEKPFQCNMCKKSFNRKDKLKRHTVIHEPIKPFKCPLSAHTGCTKAFNRADKLKAHILSHTGAKPFCCGICDRSFTRRAHLIDHERVHAKSYKFTCKLCGQGFLRRKPFQRHDCGVRKETGQNVVSSAGDLSKAAVEGQSSIESPRRGRPPKKVATTISSSSDRVSVNAVDAAQMEPSSTTATESTSNSGEVVHSAGKQSVLPADGECVGEQTTLVGSGLCGSTVTLGRLDTAVGTVYVFHPLVDDAGGQQFAFQTFKLNERPTDSKQGSKSVAACGTISEADNLTNLTCSSSDDPNTTKDVRDSSS